MDLQQATLAVCGVTAAYIWYRRRYTLSISDVPGPENPSRIHGHRWWWQCEEAGVLEKELLEEYGTVVRWNGLFGEECLWIADPKAVHHIFQVASSQYEKPSSLREGLAMIMDRGLVWAEGDVHKRQRKAMAPAFGPHESQDLNVSSPNSSPINGKACKAALDVVGVGAFNHDFGALNDTDNKFAKSYTNLIAFSTPDKGRLFVMDAIKLAPKGLVTWYLERDQSPGMVNIRENRIYAHEVAAKLIEEKRQELKNGTSQKDLLSLLIRANSTMRSDRQLTEEEIVAQVRTVMFAAHDTTTKALALSLWEFAKNRDIQKRLRTEIREKEGEIRTRGDNDFTVSDVGAMPYLVAFVKEILRVYPPFIEITRVPSKDSILPLSKPFVGVSGKVYKELPIPAGTTMLISTMGYNLNKDLWGPDAYEFRPERWLDKEETLSFGVYNNLATFSGGRTSCIGWRFAVIEIQTFLVTLVVVGEEDKGPQMPLRVTFAGDE